ncbi:MAG: DUF4363 family protein [Ruminococcus sp.]|nr:DUF4363 family protein [Ruminococcus sp.]
MTRVRIALGILAALILLSVGSVVCVNRSCSHVQNTLEQLRHAKENGDLEEAKALCGEIERRWESFQGILKMCVSYEKLAETSNIIMRLEPLLEEDCDEFAAELAQAEYMLRNITESETPDFANVF